MPLLKDLFGEKNTNPKGIYKIEKERVDILRDKIRGLEFEKENLLTLQKITATLVSNLNFEDITQKVVNTIANDLKYKGGVLFLVNKKEKYVYCHAISEIPSAKKFIKLFSKSFREYPAFFTSQNLVVRTIKSGQIFTGKKIKDFISPDCPTFIADFTQKITKTKSVISLPVIVKNEIIGGLLFCSKENQFTESEINILKTFTQQAGIAIHNAQLYKQIERQVKELEAKTKDLRSLLDISHIAASSLETKIVTQEIVNSIPDKLAHLEYLGGILVLYDKKVQCVYTYAITESEFVKRAKKLLRKPFREHKDLIAKVDNLIMQTIKNKEIQTSSKLEDFISPTVSYSIAKAIQKLVKMKSAISVPVFVHGQIIGAIVFIAKKEKNEITERDKGILRTFANQIGLTIENSQLFEKTTHQMAQLEEANSRLKELLEMREEFLHVTSHQLRTPLTAIRGMISMWHQGDFKDFSQEKQNEMIKRIYQSTERLNNITNDMLGAMELEGGYLEFKFKPVVLEKLIAEIIDTLKINYNKKGLYIKFEKSSKPLPKIQTESRYLRQVFLNIVDNAEKYTKEGGTTITISQRGRYLVTKISDTGIGITKEDQKRLFKKFSRGRKANQSHPEGSGLGLYIAKQIIEAHSGKIEVKSKGKNKGTTFIITLPIIQPHR